MSSRKKKFIISQDFISKFENEAWFSYMAGQGWHLMDIGDIFAVFEKGQPKDICYRAEILEAEKAEEKRKEYELEGWEYKGNNNHFYVFSMPRLLSPVQPYASCDQQVSMLEEIGKRIKSKIIFIGIFVLLYSAILGLWLHFDKTPVLSFAAGWNIAIVGFSFWGLWFVLAEIFYIFQLFMMRKRAAANECMPKKVNWNFRRLRQLAVQFFGMGIRLIFFGPLLMTPFISFYMDICKNHEDFASAVSREIPVVRISELEQDIIHDLKDPVEPLGTWSQNWSPIAPVQYKALESFFYSSEKYCLIETRYYKMLFPKLCITATEELIINRLSYYQDDYKNKDLRFDLYEDNRFDIVYVCQLEINEKSIIISKDNEIMEIYYRSNKETSELLDLCANIL